MKSAPRTAGSSGWDRLLDALRALRGDAVCARKAAAAALLPRQARAELRELYLAQTEPEVTATPVANPRHKRRPWAEGPQTVSH